MITEGAVTTHVDQDAADRDTADRNVADPKAGPKAGGGPQRPATPPPATSLLHARVYTLIVIFAAWFGLAVWGFAGGGLSDYLLVIVSGFIFVVVALTLILSRVGGKHDVMKRESDRLSLRDWAAADFETWGDRLSGAQAALHILLPIAVAAVGMTALGIIFQITQHGGI
jgi:hypothetical protein